MGNTLKAVLSLQSSLARLGRGAVAKGHRKQPVQPLEFYDGEFCPFCRYVREALTELDLDALVYPVPKRGSRFRQQLQQVGGKAQVPFLHDPNTGAAMYESADIQSYLFETYGDRDRSAG
jgi:glutathione S-transferase